MERVRFSIRLPADILLDAGDANLSDLPKRGHERHPQADTRHLYDVQVCAPGREFQVGADAAVRLLDLTPEIYDDGRGPEALREARAQRLRQVELVSLDDRRRGSMGFRLGPQPGGPADGRASDRGLGVPEQLPALVERREELPVPADILACAEQQQPARIQAVMKHGEQGLLCARNDVDEEVSTRDQVDSREGRIVKRVLHREHDAISHALLDSVALLLRHEESVQALFPDRARDRLGKSSHAGRLDRDWVEIGREHLQFGVVVEGLERLEHDDGDRVGLFSCRAAGYPNTKPEIVGAGGDQRREPRLCERAERFRIPKEPADADQPVSP